MNISREQFNTRIKQYSNELFGERAYAGCDNKLIREIAIELFKRERSSKLIIDYLTELDHKGKVIFNDSNT